MTEPKSDIDLEHTTDGVNLRGIQKTIAHAIVEDGQAKLAHLDSDSKQKPVQFSTKETKVKLVTLFCPAFKERNEIISDVNGGKPLILSFDKKGYCKIPASQLHYVEQYSRAFPGRIRVVADPPVVPPTPPVKPVLNLPPVQLPKEKPVALKTLPEPPKVEVKVEAPVEKSEVVKPKARKRRGRTPTKKSKE